MVEYIAEVRAGAIALHWGAKADAGVARASAAAIVAIEIFIVNCIVFILN